MPRPSRTALKANKAYAKNEKAVKKAEKDEEAVIPSDKESAVKFFCTFFKEKLNNTITAMKHNCAERDWKKSHVLNESCLKRGHMGWCPGCEKLVSFNHGCVMCDLKKDELYHCTTEFAQHLARQEYAKRNPTAVDED